MQKPETSPNVYGIETEYSCMITYPDKTVYEIVGSCHSIDSKLGLYEEPQKMGSIGINEDELMAAIESQGMHATDSGMLSNGGRLYIDPSGPEYATPETSTAEEAVLRSFDGDDIVRGVFEWLRNNGAINGYQINRRTTDHNRSSRGIHLNNATVLNPENLSDHKISRLATLNVVKGAMFGSGGLLLNEFGETEFHYSPRLSITSAIKDKANNYKKRPLVRYPFKSEGAISRVETVTSDALNFAWPMKASLIATNSLLRILELGYGYEIPELRNPESAAHNVGKNGNDNQISIVSSGGKYSSVRPLDVLRDICETALRVDDRREFLDNESDQVLQEIIDTADKMTRDKYSVADQVESVARLVTMKKKMQKDKLTLDSEAMCRFDYAWDLVGGGIAERLREKGLAGWQGIDQRQQKKLTAIKRRNTPPSDTRAKTRGDLIQKTKGKITADWTSIDSLEDFSYLEPLLEKE